MNSGPKRKDMLSFAQLEPILRQVRAEVGPVLIVFTGGEPLLLGEDLLLSIRLCVELGMPARVVTNAYWAQTRESARVTLTALKAAGLDDLNISTDDYHLPWISLQRVRNAYEIALELGFGTVVIATCYSPQSAITPTSINNELADGEMELRYDADQQPRAEIVNPQATKRGILSNPHTQRIGRAANQLWDDEFFIEETDVGDIAGGCPWAVQAPAITPKGHLVSCCGFELEDNPILDYGDLNQRSLAELLDQADGDLITNMIALIGPPKIKRVLEEVCPDEISFPQATYGTYCEVCHDLVNIEQNRRALYRHQSAFVDYVIKAREQQTRKQGRRDDE
jgi:hypothetical protein